MAIRNDPATTRICGISSSLPVYQQGDVTMWWRNYCIVTFIRFRSWWERNEEDCQMSFDEGTNLIAEHLPHVIGTLGG